MSSKPLMVYSRDMLSGPLQLYGSMLQNIRDDHFRPDESRTSRLVAFLERAEHADNAPDPTPPDSIVPEPVVSGVGPLLGVGEVQSSLKMLLLMVPIPPVKYLLPVVIAHRMITWLFRRRLPISQAHCGPTRRVASCISVRPSRMPLSV